MQIMSIREYIKYSQLHPIVFSNTFYPSGLQGESEINTPEHSIKINYGFLKCMDWFIEHPEEKMCYMVYDKKDLDELIKQLEEIRDRMEDS